MTNPMSYAGKDVVVTGAFSGVGAALVEILSDLDAAFPPPDDKQPLAIL